MFPQASSKRRLVVILLGLFALAVLTSCSQVQVQSEPLDPKIYYQRDMNLTVNGKSCQGSCVVAQAPSYDVKIESKQDVDQLVISTCKRTEVISSAIQGGWFKKRRGYVYRYTPGTLEKEVGCRLEFGGFEKDRGRHSWGAVIFEHASLTLKAGVSCNSLPDYGASGVAVCEAMKGQLMKIWFTREVRLAESAITDACKITPSVDGLNFRFKIQPRECNYLFEAKTKPFERFVLTTFGSEQLLIRAE